MQNIIPTFQTFIHSDLLNIMNILNDRHIKQILEGFLTSQDWKVVINWGDNHRIDIEARRGLERWIIEVEDCESKNSVPVNAFLMVLGKVLQRMDDSDCKYSIALPDIEPFRRLWERMPYVAMDRTRITALFVTASGVVMEINGAANGS